MKKNKKLFKKFHLTKFIAKMSETVFVAKVFRYTWLSFRTLVSVLYVKILKWIHSFTKSKIKNNKYEIKAFPSTSTLLKVSQWQNTNSFNII